MILVQDSWTKLKEKYQNIYTKMENQIWSSKTQLNKLDSVLIHNFLLQCSDFEWKHFCWCNQVFLIRNIIAQRPFCSLKFRKIDNKAANDPIAAVFQTKHWINV